MKMTTLVRNNRQVGHQLTLLLMLLLLGLVLAACGQPDDQRSATTPGATEATMDATAAPQRAAAGEQGATEATMEATAAPQRAATGEQVEVRCLFPGDAPTDWDTVLGAVNEKLQADNVGVSLNIQWIPWSDYGQTSLLKVTAGEELDCFLDAPWLHITQMILDEAIIPLDEYVSQASHLEASIPEEMWAANKFDGKIYGIPLGVIQGRYYGFVIRKDLREEYGLPPIKTYADVEKFLYTVKERGKDVTPLAAPGWASTYVLNQAYWSQQPQPVDCLAANCFLWATQKPQNPKVVPYWEQLGWLDAVKKARKFYEDGIVDKNAAVQADAVEETNLFTQGKYAAMFTWQENAPALSHQIESLQSSVPGAEVEVVFPYDQANPKPLSEFKQNNFLVIPRSSPHPEKVIALMDWLSIRENHDLLAYGIPGKHWEAVGEDHFETVSGTAYSFPGFVMTWRPALERLPTGVPPTLEEWFQRSKDPENFTPSPYIGFTFNAEPVLTELTQVQALNNELFPPIASGLVDPEEGLATLKERLNGAGYQKVLDEAEKQATEFLAKNE